MELSDPTRPIPLGIDLNSTPSPSSDSPLPSPLSFVRTFHYISPSDGLPASLPSSSSSLTCAACDFKFNDGHVAVCDSCERGFHLSCVVGERILGEEWRCEECVKEGVKSKRWPLGRAGSGSGVRLLDINALPVSSDGEGEELCEIRKQIPGDYICGGNPFGAPTINSKYLYEGNGYGYQAFRNTRHTTKLGFEDMLNHRHTLDRSIEDVKFSSLPIEALSRNGDTAALFQAQNLSEMFLQALREYISEKHGVLEEGWHVEFRQSRGNCEQYAIYCAPDGKMFDSMSEVAFHLGLVSTEHEIRSEESRLLQKRLRQPKRRRSKQALVANGFSKAKNTLVTGFFKELPFNMKTMEICNNNLGYSISSTESGRDQTVDAEYQQLNDGLPVQYEDFFVLSLGKIVRRSSYHDLDHIWPVGYRSCWHDKITGSIFICDVLDGGNQGPVFRVKRCSCSSLPIPVGSTVLVMSKFGQPDDLAEESANKIYNMDSDEIDAIQTILTDSCPPGENDIISCLGINCNKDSDCRISNKNQIEANFHEGNANKSSGKLDFKDEIGELLEEGHVLASVWRMVCQKIIEKCGEIYKQTGTFEFLCKHLEHITGFSCWDTSNEKAKVGSTSLAKFCSSSGFARVASKIRVDYELEALSGLLEKWLYQDRFGLDVEFVQEILEQLPGIDACTNYEPLNTRRCSRSPLLTVGSGLLLIKTESGGHGKEEEIVNGLFGGSRKSIAKQVKDSSMEVSCPLGRPLGSLLPLELVGDVLQISEFIWRFYEVLGLKEPLSFEELEEELISPWFDGSNILEKFKAGVREHQDLFSHETGDTNGANANNLSSNNESEAAVSRKNLQSFIHMETEATREATQARLASITYSRCTGVSLTKAHCSLLKVLVTELLAKVAFLVDPNIDAGEYKSRRGKRRDIDSSLPSKRTKLNMLPINELTWPDIARRYVLAVLTMDGNLDSAEITNRESGKVFRCLQGDGGVLCGSLTGLVGMEADALLLAEATKKIFGSLNRESDSIILENEGSDAIDDCEVIMENDYNMPEWAQALEPARKLPTNVGTRIRKCVYDALEKDPPEWARNILQHSISKEVYKGNASGPTKKAVISVLDSISRENVRHKPETEGKRKSVVLVSISETVMKQCRIILRRAAAEDDGKVFCTLLGRKLMNSSDNDDEGLLGSPAMVSRPLDFRTIDLRLAYGAYGGSHEAFLEDVRELWNNVRSAYGDQPELVVLAETLSNNFEALYEKEVLALVEKLMSAKSEGVSAEMKKELNDILLVTNEIPKAPWDEGVCKVCGIDRDDDSVLLCDTCDAEYHTYCLNPPLARIPDGNWYCPSCVAGKFAQDVSEGTYVPGQRGKRKYQGEYTRHYLEALTNLETIMEEKEYWDYGVDERVFLLKFLCDELLNSALLRQHLEQCAETSAELQQKMRSLSLEWKNLKLKEDILSARVAKVHRDSVEVVRDVGTAEVLSTEVPGYTGNSKYVSPIRSENLLTCSNQVAKPLDTGDVHSVLDGSLEQDSLLSHVVSSKNDNCHGHNGLPSDLQGPCCPSETNNVHVPESVPANDSLDYSLELNTVRSDALLLQVSIANVESQILKQTARREFLGSDSTGRLYWASATTGRHPSLIVDRSVAVLPEKQTTTDYQTSFGNDTFLGQSRWICYQSDAEFEQLIRWLKDTEPKDRELKESILHLRRLRFQFYQHSGIQDLEEPQTVLSCSINGTSDYLGSRAATVLEIKYGPCFDPGNSEISRKWGRKGKLDEGKMYRCECLESIWPSRSHCFSCHRTFCTDIDLEKHNDSGCSSGSSSFEKSKENTDLLKAKGIVRSETRREDSTGEREAVKGTRSGCSEFSSSLIKFQNEGLVCPYDYEEICAKFVTNDSNRELVEGIGLIGFNGVPKFISSLPPYLSDPALALVSQKDGTKTILDPNASEMTIFSESNVSTIFAGKEANISFQNGVANKNIESRETNKPAVRRLEQKDKKSRLSSRAPLMDVGRCCVVPQSSLKPLVGKVSQILKCLKINLLDMDAALPEEALRPSKAHLQRRWALRAFVKSANTIFEMVQATIILEDMIKTEYLSNCWWYWSSLSAAAKVSTLSSLALRIHSLDAAIIYEKFSSDTDVTDNPSVNLRSEQNFLQSSDPVEKPKISRRPNKRRKEAEG